MLKIYQILKFIINFVLKNQIKSTYEYIGKHVEACGLEIPVDIPIKQSKR